MIGLKLDKMQATVPAVQMWPVCCAATARLSQPDIVAETAVASGSNLDKFSASLAVSHPHRFQAYDFNPPPQKCGTPS